MPDFYGQVLAGSFLRSLGFIENKYPSQHSGMTDFHPHDNPKKQVRKPCLK